MVFKDLSQGGKATVMKCNGTNWVVVGNAGFSDGGVNVDSAVQIAFGPGDDPYVAFQDAANGSNVTVMEFSGSSWSLVGSAGFTSGGAGAVSLSFDSLGSPFVAYRDAGNGNKLSVMQFDGSDWISVGSPGFSESQATYTSLALSDDVLHVGFVDNANGNKATVMVFK